MHLFDHAAHDCDGTGRSGHDAAAQTGQIEFPETRMIEHRNEHGRDAVKTGALLRLDRLQGGKGVEAAARIDSRGAVAHAIEVSHAHAEAVVERNGDADAIRLGRPYGLADEEALVEYVSVSQGCAFRG